MPSLVRSAASTPLHASLLQAPRGGSGGLPFTLEPTLHERPAAAASTLSGLDHGSLRRALHAFGNRPHSGMYEAGLFAVDPVGRRASLVPSQAGEHAGDDSGGGDYDDWAEIAAAGSGDAERGFALDGPSYTYDPQSRQNVQLQSRPGSRPGVQAPHAAGHLHSAPTGSVASSLGISLRASVEPSAGVGSPRLGLSPRSLALHTPRSVRNARKRWKLVRQHLWRIVRDARDQRAEAAGVGVGVGGAGPSLWSIAMDKWEERSIENALRSFAPLRPLSTAELQYLTQYASLVTVARYTQIFKKGTPLTSCHLILQGSVRLVGNKEGEDGLSQRGVTWRRVLESGAFCGGGAWLPGALHVDTATALKPCVLLSINAADAQLDPKLRDVCARLATALGDPWKVDLLHNYVPFFADLPPVSLEQLAPLFDTRFVPPGEMLIREGEPPDYVYVLVQGDVRIFRQGKSGAPVELAHITDQSEFTYFGELALYDNKPRTASIQAVERCFLLVLEERNFETFSELVPDFGKRVKMLKAVHDAKMTAANGAHARVAHQAPAFAAPESVYETHVAPAAAGAVDEVDALPVATLGLADWIATVKTAEAMPVPTIPTKRLFGSSVVVTTTASGFTLPIKASKESVRSSDPASERTALLKKAAAAAEAARSAMIANS